MGKKCEICGKGRVTGNNISHSHKKSKRTWSPNLQKIKATVNGRPKRILACTRCIRSGKVEKAL